MQAAVHLNDKSFAQGHLTDSSREGGEGNSDCLLSTSSF